MTTKRRIVLTHGEPGTPIKGSSMYRGYCISCHEAIRVTTPQDAMRRSCEVCSGVKKDLMPGGYAGPTDEDGVGSWGNVISAMEGD